MITLALACMLAQTPVGAYGMPELCKLLSSETGVTHSVDAALSDYPVFVSVKSGDPGRVKQLVAIALHATWISQDGKSRLKLVEPARDEDVFEFSRQLKEATKLNKKFAALPVRELYEMAPGEIVRYGETPSDFIRPLPPGFADESTSDRKTYLIRRLCAGVFEFGFSDDQEIEFASLPSTVTDLLGQDLAKQPLSPDQLAKITQQTRDPESLKIDWKLVASRDPVAEFEDPLLKPVGGAIGPDLVMVLPDFALLSMMEPLGTSPTVATILKKFSLCDDWKVVDGAVVGALTYCELKHPSQAKRDVLAEFFSAIGSKGIANANDLSQYVAEQRPAASESWGDAMMLALAGVIIDSDFLGDYPFNLRMYLHFEKDDWALIRSGKPFLASQFGPAVQTDLLNILLQSRVRLDKKFPDPADWQTLDFTRLTVTATLTEESVLIGFTMPGGEIEGIQTSALQYDMRRKQMKEDPLYQVATRKTLKIRINSPVTTEEVETGFTDVTPTGGKPVVWTQLPPDLAAEFKQALEDSRQRQGTDGRKPPP